MKHTIRQITSSALLLALLISLQWITKPLGQLVTGSAVNTVLAISALTVGLNGAVFIALVSPVFAFLLGIAPQLVTVPAIMVGNSVLVSILYLGRRKACLGRFTPVLFAALAAVSKSLLLYVLVARIICGPASEALLNRGLLKTPMLNLLPAMFSWPQLITALIGSYLASALAPLIQKTTGR